MLTQPNIESLKKVVADMISNTQILKTTVEAHLRGEMSANVNAAMQKIMDYQTSCTWKDGWIWNAQTWESTMLVWKTIQEKMQSYHDLYKQIHTTKDEFEGVKLLRECKICVGDMLQYKKTCTNEKTWKDEARQVVGLQPTKMQMLKKLGEHCRRTIEIRIPGTEKSSSLSLEGVVVVCVCRVLHTHTRDHRVSYTHTRPPRVCVWKLSCVCFSIHTHTHTHTFTSKSSNSFIIQLLDCDHG
jgi:hypothetical protein